MPARIPKLRHESQRNSVNRPRQLAIHADPIAIEVDAGDVADQLAGVAEDVERAPIHPLADVDVDGLGADDEEALVGALSKMGVAQVASEHTGELAGAEGIGCGRGRQWVGGAEGGEEEKGEEGEE